jgi:hypothetical protein
MTTSLLPTSTSSVLLLAAALTGAAAAPMCALEEQKGEAQAIEACDRRLCSILLDRNPSGEDLKCVLSKTWARSTLKEGDQPSLTWGFGDARCSITLQITRASIVAAITSRKTHKFWVPPHTANCVVEEGGQLKPLKATLEPKIEFKNGQAEKIWINLRRVEGSASIKDWVSLAAGLTDKTGIFHRQMIKSVNRYIYRDCPRKYPQAQAATPAPKAK